MGRDFVAIGIAMGFACATAVVLLPVELVLLEAAGIKLGQKMKVIGYLAIPKALFWLALGAVRRVNPGAVLALVALAQLGASYYALGLQQVGAARRVAASLLLLVVCSALLVGGSILAFPFMVGRF